MMLPALYDDELVTVQEEPALEIALPQVFTQPPLTVLRRGKLPQAEWLIAKLVQSAAEPSRTQGLGPDYQALVNEFQPLFTWAMACWDFLLSTEGCRFVLRGGDEKLCSRGEYRAVTDRDYSRLVHRVFRQCVVDFAGGAAGYSFPGLLRTRFWDLVVEAYRRLEDPPDPRQRKLTPYSYLRCAPYRFLNDYHHELVTRTIQKLPQTELHAIERYFLNFYTLPAAAQVLSLPEDRMEERLRRGLLTLLLDDRLVYCLLRQIERY